MTGRLGAALDSVVAWLRTGYPDRAPRTSYIPLLALLARRLTREETAAAAHELMRRGDFDGADIDTADIGVAITRVTDALPSPEDIARVRSRICENPAGRPPLFPR